jgi:hypothetical protein
VRVGGTTRRGAKSNFWGVLVGLLGVVLSRDQNLFHVLIGNDYDKMLYLTNISIFSFFFSCAPIYISNKLVVAFLVFFIS